MKYKERKRENYPSIITVSSGEISYVWFERERRKMSPVLQMSFQTLVYSHIMNGWLAVFCIHYNFLFCAFPISHSLTLQPLCILISVKYCTKSQWACLILFSRFDISLTHNQLPACRLLLIPPPTHPKNNKHLLFLSYNTFE